MDTESKPKSICPTQGEIQFELRKENRLLKEEIERLRRQLKDCQDADKVGSWDLPPIGGFRDW